MAWWSRAWAAWAAPLGPSTCAHVAVSMWMCKWGISRHRPPMSVGSEAGVVVGSLSMAEVNDDASQEHITWQHGCG